MCEATHKPSPLRQRHYEVDGGGVDPDEPSAASELAGGRNTQAPSFAAEGLSERFACQPRIARCAIADERAPPRRHITISRYRTGSPAISLRDKYHAEPMSADGPSRHFAAALHSVAFGVKRTSTSANHKVGFLNTPLGRLILIAGWNPSASARLGSGVRHAWKGIDARRQDCVGKIAPSEKSEANVARWITLCLSDAEPAASTPEKTALKGPAKQSPKKRRR
jgi:hypothetical protein